MSDKEIKTISKDVVVTMDYSLEIEGKEIDAGPIQFLHGHGNIIPGLESEVEGMAIGDEKEVFIKAEEAYGTYNPELEIDVPLDNFPEDFEIKLGHPMRIQDGEGHVFTGVAMAITDTMVKLNLNHPLAGKDLNFKTKVTDLRAATELEKEQGRLTSDCSGCASSNCSDC